MGTKLHFARVGVTVAPRRADDEQGPLLGNQVLPQLPDGMGDPETPPLLCRFVAQEDAEENGDEAALRMERAVQAGSGSLKPMPYPLAEALHMVSCSVCDCVCDGRA